MQTEEGEKALRSVFASRPEVFQSIDFARASLLFLGQTLPRGLTRSSSWDVAEYWTTLTAEKALLARVFADHCRETKASSPFRFRTLEYHLANPCSFYCRTKKHSSNVCQS